MLLSVHVHGPNAYVSKINMKDNAVRYIQKIVQINQVALAASCLLCTMSNPPNEEISVQIFKMQMVENLLI